MRYDPNKDLRRCGTTAGKAKHEDRNEPLCDRCDHAWSWYQDRLARLRAKRAAGRAEAVRQAAR